MIGGSGDEMYLVKRNFEIYLLSEEILQLAIQCKKEAKLDNYAINNTTFISRLKKIAILGYWSINEIWKSRVQHRLLFRPWFQPVF